MFMIKQDNVLALKIEVIRSEYVALCLVVMYLDYGTSTLYLFGFEK